MCDLTGERRKGRALWSHKVASDGTGVKCSVKSTAVLNEEARVQGAHRAKYDDDVFV